MKNLDPSREAVIVDAIRTPVGKAKRGSLATTRPDEMAAVVIQELLKRAEGLDPAEVDDVILGCAFPEGEQGMNMTRLVALRAGYQFNHDVENFSAGFGLMFNFQGVGGSLDYAYTNAEYFDNVNRFSLGFHF